MTNAPDTNAAVIESFRANAGQVPAPYDDPPPMALLHTIGARSGREHIVPMRCLPEADAVVVFATAHGSERHPDWYRNLIANPDIVIELGADTVPVHATELVGDERERAIARWIARVPPVAAVFERTARPVPAMRLAFASGVADVAATHSDTD